MPEILDKVLSCALGGFYFSGKSGLFSVLGAVLTGISTIFSDPFPGVASQRRSIMRMSPSEQIIKTWNLDDLGECRNEGQKMPESRLKDGDWKCIAYTDSQRTELTVHINGNKVGLYKADGKALAANRKD